MSTTKQMNLKLNLDVDDKSVKLATEQIRKDLFSVIDENKVSDSFKDSLNLSIKAFEEQQKKLLQVKKFETGIEAFRQLGMDKEAKELEKQLKQFKKDNGIKDDDNGPSIKESALDLLDTVEKKAIKTITQIGTDILDAAKTMIEDIADYSGHATRFNQDVVSMKMNYGLTGAQAYAYQKAAEDTGFGSFENYLANLAFADQETLERFDKLIEEYELTYEETKDMASSYQKLQTEFEDFKKEVAMELLKFIADNKDLIKTSLQVSTDVLKGLLSAVQWLVSFFGYEDTTDRSAYEKDAAKSDIYTSYGGNKNINVKVDNSFTGVAASDKAAYQDAAAMLYRQVIAALE